MFFRARIALAFKPAIRFYSSAASPNALVFLEHAGGIVESSSLSAVTAASQLGGKVTGLVIGASEQVSAVLEKAKRVQGLDVLLYSSSEQYAHPLPEFVTPLFQKLLSDTPFTHVVAPASSFSKSLLPRLAAKLDVPAVSDATSVEHDSSSGATTFTRPIYAGNAISTVRAPAFVHTKLFTIRSTAFSAAPYQDGKEAEVKELAPVQVSDSPTQHINTTLAKSDRPELGAASRIVSGGRPLKNAETFQSILYPLADTLGAAVGASRAAVDAGYADNSLQVGQTGKVVAPELYMAVGISGAIQHLAGMKDSKMIVAINKDADAPIFQVADYGLVADLYEAVPELTEKLKK